MPQQLFFPKIKQNSDSSQTIQTVFRLGCIDFLSYFTFTSNNCQKMNLKILKPTLDSKCFLKLTHTLIAIETKNATRYAKLSATQSRKPYTKTSTAENKIKQHSGRISPECCKSLSSFLPLCQINI